MTLPNCGLYRTTKAIGAIPAGRLVYFHNHGSPGPGLYTPHRWVMNRAEWHQQGQTLTDEAEAHTLEALPAEGLYRVREAFHCCEKRCVLFDAERLVQLGYDGAGEAIVFFPELTPAGLTFPERGNVVGRERLSKLELLKVNVGTAVALPGGLLH